MRGFWRRKPKQPPLRTGIFQVSFQGSGLLNRHTSGVAQVTVSEWQRVGSLSRVRVERVSGTNEPGVRTLVPDWIPTDSVLWLP